MGAKILKFKPRPDNKIYFPENKGKEVVGNSQGEVVELSKFQPKRIPERENKIKFIDSQKMKTDIFSKKEAKTLEDLGYKFDEQYGYYWKDEYWSIEIIEKREGNFFYIEPIAFSMFPVDYQHFESLEEALDYLKAVAG